MKRIIWWCESKGEGMAIRASRGTPTWKNYCAPHIDFRYNAERPWRESHLKCGLRKLEKWKHQK